MLAMPDAQRLVGVHPATGKDETHRATFTHRPGQAHGPAVIERKCQAL